MRANLLAMTGACHVAAQNFDASLLHLAGTGEQREQTGFAHAIRANQSHHSPRRNVQRDAGECDGFAVVQADINQTGDGRGTGLRRIHSGTLIAKFAGHSAFASSLSQATPGKPVLTSFRFFCSSSRPNCALTRNISFCRSLAVSTVLGVN